MLQKRHRHFNEKKLNYIVSIIIDQFYLFIYIYKYITFFYFQVKENFNDFFRKLFRSNTQNRKFQKYFSKILSISFL
jgi:hypothetical protein